MRRPDYIPTVHDGQPRVLDAQYRVTSPVATTRQQADDAVLLARVAAERPPEPGQTTRGEAAIAASILALADSIERLIEHLAPKEET